MQKRFAKKQKERAKKMAKNQLKGSLMLLLTALIWGCAFVAQSKAMDSVEPFTFQAARSILGALVLIPLIIFNSNTKPESKRKTSAADRKILVTGGIICGVLLCLASNLQQLGIVTTTPGKAGFITAMYILLVPVFGLAFGKKVEPKIWFCILVAVIGLYFLCVADVTIPQNASFFQKLSAALSALKFTSGDIYVILCAVVFAFHILAVDRFSPLTDGVKLSCIQFFTCAVISAVLMFIFEKPSFANIVSAAVPILYAGIGSCGVAYTLQIIGQKYTQPTVASLVMSLESVFAVLAQIVIMHIVPSNREIIGCVLVFAAIIVAQLPPLGKKAASGNM